jgi:flagellar hook-associated protein 1 FlgK
MAMSAPADVAAATAGAGTLDGGNALVAGGLGGKAGSADALYGALVGDLASASALSKQTQATQGSVTAHVDTLRDSVSGVSLDEEVSNMLTYQRTFQAASRVLTTVDDLLDTLINRTGLVGR